MGLPFGIFSGCPVDESLTNISVVFMISSVVFSGKSVGEAVGLPFWMFFGFPFDESLTDISVVFKIYSVVFPGKNVGKGVGLPFLMSSPCPVESLTNMSVVLMLSSVVFGESVDDAVASDDMFIFCVVLLVS